jgi:hypothetical protein
MSEDVDLIIKDGKHLETIVASYFQALSYYVDSNLKWIEDKEDSSGKVDILELDVLAKIFDASFVRTTLIECKRGCTFNDIFKFSGVAKLVAADINLLIGQSHDILELKSVGEKIDIQVKSPEELFLSISDEQNQKMILFYSSNSVSNAFFDKETIRTHASVSGRFSANEQKVYNSIRGFMAELIGKIWRESNLIEQSIQIKTLLDTHPDFVRAIARQLQIKPGNKSSEFYMNQNLLCQAAGFLVLKIRVSYVICAVNCAITLGNGVLLPLDKISDVSFVNVVNLLRKDLVLTSKIPLFLQELIYIFGGMVSLIDNDLENIAKYMKSTVPEIRAMIFLLKQLFQLSETRIQWGFVEDMDVLSLKYIPTPLKGVGIANRERLGYSVLGFCFAEQWKRSLDIYNL